MPHNTCENNTPKFRLTLFTNDQNRPLSKQIAIGKDGRPQSTAAANMVAGTAQPIEAEGIKGVAAIVGACSSAQAISLGAIKTEFQPEHGAMVKVTIKEDVKGRPGVIARSKDFLAFEPGAGLMLLDFDSKQMPLRVEMCVAFLDGVEGTLLAIFPQLKNAARFTRASTSAGIYNSKSGKKYRGGDGSHIYVGVADATDVPRALKVVHARLILAGFGWGFVSESGAILTRSIVDVVVGAPERLVFEGAPIVTEPLRQDAAARACRVTEGGLLDTCAVFPDLTLDEKRRYQAAVEALRAERAEDAARLRKASDGRIVAKIVKEGAVSQEEAARRVALRHKGELAPEITITFDDPALGEKTVAEIYDNPETYIGKTACDPLAGLEYGRGKCKIFRDEFGLLFATSFAHGWTVYKLLPGAGAVERLLKQKNARLVEVFAQWAVTSEALWSAEEKARFRKEVAVQTGVGLREISAAKKAAKQERHNQARAEMAEKADEPSVVLGGSRKRVVTVEDVDTRFGQLEAPGLPTAFVYRPDSMPITTDDLQKRLGGEVVMTGVDDDGTERYAPAAQAWRDYAGRHRYRRIVFTNDPNLPSDTLNLFRGLGVVPKAGDCSKIINHVFEVLAADDWEVGGFLIKLCAWQLQNIGKPSRVVVVLKSEQQQVGKGLLLNEVLCPIFGRSAFLAAGMEQIVGRFNAHLSGVSLVFLDEVLFAGDKKAGDALKMLSTAATLGLEAKGVPVIQSPVAFNFWLCSNHKAAAHVEKADARYVVLDVSPHRFGDRGYFDELLREINNGGREAFAHYLLNLDLVGFVPWQDMPKTTAKRAMQWESVNPYDARKWLEACCHAGVILGLERRPWGAAQWVEGMEISFADLVVAYSDWQRTVKSPIAPQPTKAGALGPLLSQVGFGVCRTNAERKRTLPTMEECLEALPET